MSSINKISNQYAQSRAEIELVSTGGIDARFVQEWQSLAQNAAFANPFFEHWFLNQALGSFEQYDTVYLLVARDVATRQMVGLVPIVKKLEYRKIPLPYFQTWIHPFCFNGIPLIARDWTTAFYEAAAAWIDTSSENARFLQLLAHPYSPPIKSVIDDGFGSSRVFVQNVFERTYLEKKFPALDTFDGYFKKTISSKHRSNLRRMKRRLGDKGKLTLGEMKITNHLIEDYLSLEKRGWKNPKNHGLKNDQVAINDQFIKSLLLNGAQDGRVYCRGMKIDGRPIAMSFQFMGNDHIAGFKTVYDETYAAYSPSVHVLMDVIKDYFKDPTIKSFDSCSQAGNSLLMRLLSDRLPIAQLNLTQSNRLDRALMSVLDIVGK